MVKKKKKVKKKIKVRKKVAVSKKSKNRLRKRGLTLVYLGLGSNVGDREEYIEQAVFLLGKYPKIEVGKHSSNYETEPEGAGTSNQPPFLNAVVEIKTKLSPYDLLLICHEIEATLGREREIDWGPRTIDIDILLFGGEIISDEKLSIPHPLMHERLFVLKPLRDVAPQALHPILEKSIDTLYDERKAETGTTYDDELPGFREIKGGSHDDYERW